MVLQTINGFFRGIGKQKSLLIGVTLLILMLIGLSLSILHLGPFIQFGDELTRFDLESRDAKEHYLYLEMFPGFFMSNEPIRGPITMTSIFVTIPILIFASFFPISSIKKYWIFFVMLIIAVLMAMGSKSLLWQAITYIIPTLELSRFPISDYRIFIAIPLMIFAVVGLKAVFERKFTSKTFAYRIPFILSWFSFGIFSLYSNFRIAGCVDCEIFYNITILNQQTALAISILGISISILAYFVIKQKNYNSSSIKKPIGLSIIGVILLGGIVAADGFRFISDMDQWRIETFDERYVAYNIPLQKDGKLTTYSIFENLPNERPERKIFGTADENTNACCSFKWKGVLTGDFMLGDSGNTVLQSRVKVVKSNIYTEFMLMKWTPLLLDPNIDSNQSKIYLLKQKFSKFDKITEQTSVIQTHYGINDITYQVSLDEPKLMIENEIYFPGWTATLIYPDKQLELEAKVVNDVFRAWLLPEGDYEMIANFEFPNFVNYQIISLSALMVWIGTVIVFWKKQFLFT